MGNKYFQKIISSLVIISFVFVIPYLRFAEVAKAQSVSSYITGVAGAITQFPSCQKELVNVVKNLFNGTNGLDYTTSSKSSVPYGPTESGGNLSDKETAAKGQSENVPVDLPKTTTELIQKTYENTLSTSKTSKALSDNDTCLKSIGRLVIKMLLQKLTTSTVEWINGGYDGSPKFIQDPGTFFKDMAKDEVLQFGIELNDKTLYPFAQSFMQAETSKIKNTFSNNAKYSFDIMMQQTNPNYTPGGFQDDFSQGGWYAWDAMTQMDANNPMGFAMMASKELEKRISEKVQEKKDELAQSGGYLGDRRCVNPTGVTWQEHQDALRGSSNMYNNETGTARRCLQWATVTPGGMIADAATKTMNYQSDSLLKADDLNAAIAAIIDALLNSFTSNIQNKGFAELPNTQYFQEAEGGQMVLDPDSMAQYGSSRVSDDFSEFQIASSTFLSTHPDFNIRTDLNQALIDEQRVFTQKIIEQNRGLKSTVPKTQENPKGNAGLIPITFQLDYCIPGPHPGFETDSRNALNAALGTIPAEDENTIKDKDKDAIAGLIKDSLMLAATAAGAVIGASIGTVVPVIGNIIGTVIGAVVGFIVGLLYDLFSDTSTEKKIQAYYAGQIYNMTGIKVCKYGTGTTGCKGGAIQTAAYHNKISFDDSINKILDRYIKIIYDVFPIEKLPTSAGEAAIKFGKIKGYLQMYKNNEDRIVSMQSIINRLVGIKKEIDSLNCQLDPIPDSQACLSAGYTSSTLPMIMSQEEYETALQPWITSFGRLSAEMVSGDDIAVVDNTNKQIQDEKDYVYRNLLKGPAGCEKDLELDRQGLAWQIYDTKRMEYPGPILYDYNDYTNGQNLPDPFGSGFENHMINTWSPGGAKVPLNSFGPGFLSYVTFERSGDAEPTLCSSYYVDGKCHDDGSDREHLSPQFKDILHVPLIISDLFMLRDISDATIGHVPDYAHGGDPSNNTGIFEIMIGIY